MRERCVGLRAVFWFFSLGKKTKKIHKGLIVPWYSTKVFEDLGFKDSFREENPNPIKYPGVTWDHKERDDSQRIDYVFYKGRNLKTIESKTYMQFINEDIKINSKIFKYFNFKKN